MRELGDVEPVDLLEPVEGLGGALEVSLGGEAAVAGADLADLAKGL